MKILQCLSIQFYKSYAIYAILEWILNSKIFNNFHLVSKNLE